MAQIAEEHRHARAGDRASVLDDPVQVFLSHLVRLHRARVHREPCETFRLVDAERLQHFGKQPNATGRR